MYNMYVYIYIYIAAELAHLASLRTITSTITSITIITIIIVIINIIIITIIIGSSSSSSMLIIDGIDNKHVTITAAELAHLASLRRYWECTNIWDFRLLCLCVWVVSHPKRHLLEPLKKVFNKS